MLNHVSEQELETWANRFWIKIRRQRYAAYWYYDDSRTGRYGKKEIAVKVQQFLAKELNIDEKFVSVSIEEVEKEEWAAPVSYTHLYLLIRYVENGTDLC